MPYPLYLSSTLLLLILLMLGAIFIKDIGTIFEWLSAVTVSCLAFLFPGYFCIKAANQFLKTEQDRADNKCVLI